MRRFILIIVILLSLALPVFAEEPKEVLSLKKELAQTKLFLLQERIGRLQAELWIANEQVKAVQEEMAAKREGED